MPELPEVETVVNSLKRHVEGQKIADLWVDPDYPAVIADITPLQLKRRIKDQRIRRVFRRAKYIVFELDRGYLLVHLRMTGHLQPSYNAELEKKHLRATLLFKGQRKLFFVDYRKFGRLYYYKDLSLLEDRLGVEPLSAVFNSRWLTERFSKRARALKPLLLDQSFIAGLGNIYVDEALFRARLHPQTLCNQLSEEQAKKLVRSIKTVLRQGIKHNGTTFSSFYFGDRQAGKFKEQLAVFGRNGKSCRHCEETIIKFKVAQRGTHICPGCQVL